MTGVGGNGHHGAAQSIEEPNVTADPYGDEQLVELYDGDNPPGDDHAYYRALADEIGARKIVDLGCGTGLLTRALAAVAGRTVIGVDPSPTMLGYARRQAGADRVGWIEGDASAIPPTGDLDLVISTGNAMMHIGPDDYPAVLRSLAAAMRPGAVISFESRNPAARAWTQWTREATYSERDTHIVRAGWHGEPVTDSSRLLVFRAVLA